MAQDDESGGRKYLAVPTSDAVYIVVFGVPGGGAEGFVPYRADAGSSDFKPLADTPVRAIRDMDEAKQAVGEKALTEIFSAMNVMTIEDLFKEYETSPARYDVFTIFSMDLARVLGRLYVDKDVTPGAQYSYKVSLVNASGGEVQALPASKVTVVPSSVSTPAGFTAEAKDGGVMLKWDKPAESFEGVGWEIFRATSKDGPFEKANAKLLTVMGETFFYEVTLENDKTYYYYLVGVDMAGNPSKPTQTLEVTPKDTTPPGPPANLDIALKDDGSIALSWDMNLEPDVASYAVFRGSAKDADDFAAINKDPLPADQTEYLDADVEQGTMYFYRAVATDKAGNASDNSVTVSLQPEDTTPPESPIQVTGTPKDKGILIEWEQNKEKDLFGYYVFRGDTQDALEQITTGVIEGDTFYADFGVVSGESYYYSVAALDKAFNESVRSTVIKVRAPDTIPPEFPAGLFAQPLDSQVALSWPANMESDLAGYRIYRSASADGQGADYVRVGEDIDPATTSFADTSVANGTQYWYYATAFDDSGNESASSTLSPALPRDDVPPAPPVAPAAEVNADYTAVALTWEAGSETDIAGYNVLRSDMRTGAYEKISGDSALPADTLTFTDATITDPEKEYYYRVTAWDTSGNQSLRSEPAGPFTLKKEEPAPEVDNQDNGAQENDQDE